MQAAVNQFLPFLDGKKQFMIPIYQRTYSWTHEQCEQLWNDIIQTAINEQAGGHFIGSIVYIQQGQTVIANIPQYLVIDGQQRLTTLSLLLVALSQKISREDIYDSYLINKHGENEQRYKLLLTQGDKEALIQIVEHPERVASAKTTNRLVENYLYFEERIR